MLCKNSMRYSGYEQNFSYSPKKKKKSLTSLSLLILFIIGTTSYWEPIFNKNNHRFKLDNTVVKYLVLAIKLRTRGNDYTDPLIQLWALHLPPDQMLQFSEHSNAKRLRVLPFWAGPGFSAVWHPAPCLVGVSRQYSTPEKTKSKSCCVLVWPTAKLL